MFAEYTLKNANGMTVTVSRLGAALISCRVPVSGGETREVVLASQNIEEMLREGTSYAGAIVGRYAGRIAKARYSHNGQVVELSPKKPAPFCLHGGKFGFSWRPWDIIADKQELICSRDSLAWEDEFPGNMHVEVRYFLDDNNRLTIDYRAESDADTACNLTNHAYFNLNGGDGDNGLEQKLQIFAEEFQPVTVEGLPDGGFQSVDGTSFDFRAGKMLSADFEADEQQKRVGGYDHSFILPPKVGELRQAAILQSADEAVTLTVSTTQPALHLYTGQGLMGLEKRDGSLYQKCAGVALETQAPPDSPNLHPDWGILPANVLYQHSTVLQF